MSIQSNVLSVLSVHDALVKIVAKIPAFTISKQDQASTISLSPSSRIIFDNSNIRFLSSNTTETFAYPTQAPVLKATSDTYRLWDLPAINAHGFTDNNFQIFSNSTSPRYSYGFRQYENGEVWGIGFYEIIRDNGTSDWGFFYRNHPTNRHYLTKKIFCSDSPIFRLLIYYTESSDAWYVHTNNNFAPFTTTKSTSYDAFSNMLNSTYSPVTASRIMLPIPYLGEMRVGNTYFIDHYIPNLFLTSSLYLSPHQIIGTPSTDSLVAFPSTFGYRGLRTGQRTNMALCPRKT